MEVLIAGDFCPNGRVKRLLDENHFEEVLGEVKGIVSDVDYSIINFECPVVEGYENPILKWGPNLCCSAKGIESLKWAGIDCVTLANNHLKDYGEEGVRNTLNACKKYDLDVVGAGVNLYEASKTLYKVINGKTIGIINCCEHEFSIASSNSGGSNPLNPIQQYYAIKDARKKADYVLVIIHGGHEHFQLPSPRMKETYRFFIDAGADAVVNHHQHCFSGYEIYNGRFIFYGLGNFCFDGNRSNNEMWNEGYMVKLDLDNTVLFEIIPYVQCKDEPKVRLVNLSAYNKSIDNLNNIIMDPNRLNREINHYYQLCSENYSNIIEPCNNKYYLALKRRGLLPSFISNKRKIQAANFVCCEAHREKLIYYLTKCNKI